MRPIPDGVRRNPESRFFRHAATVSARCGVFPGKEGQDSAGFAPLVAVVEVIGARIVKIDGPFHEAQAERARVEIDVPGWISRDGGDVMDAGHGSRSCRAERRWGFGCLQTESRSARSVGNERISDQTVAKLATVGVIG